MQYPFLKPTYYFSLFKDIRDFIIHPTNTKTLNKSTKFKIYDTIGLFILKLAFLIPLLLFFALVYDPKNIQSASMAERFSPIAFLFVGGIILPLVEEVAFRLSLKFKPIYLALSTAVFFYYILTKLVFHTKISAIDESFAIRFGGALAVGLVLFPLLNINAVEEKLSRFWTKHFRIIYYTSCLIFAWIHLSKYEITWLNILLLPIITLPQLMSAIINGYTRVKFGFSYPLLFHISNNLASIGLSFLPFTD